MSGSKQNLAKRVLALSSLNVDKPNKMVICVTHVYAYLKMDVVVIFLKKEWYIAFKIFFRKMKFFRQYTFYSV